MLREAEQHPSSSKSRESGRGILIISQLASREGQVTGGRSEVAARLLLLSP